MSSENLVRCEYLMKDNRSCLKVAAGEGVKARKQYCSGVSKDLCCRPCRSLKECKISCTEVPRLETEEREALAHSREAQETRFNSIKQNIENLVTAGRFEDAAQLYEKLGMWDKAGECRRMARTSYVVAADVHLGEHGISVKCPHCGSAERLESKTSEVKCKHCGQEYFIPKKILDMI